MGHVLSGYFIPSKPPQQYLVAEDRELLKEIEKSREPTRFPEAVVTQLVLERQHLTSSTRGKGEEDIIKVIAEIGPIQTHRALYHRIDNFDLDTLRRLWAFEKKIAVGRFTERGLSYVRVADLPIYTALREANREILTDRDRLVLGVIEKEGAMSKGRIASLTGLEKTSVEESLERLEESLSVLRTISYDTELETQQVTLYEPIENYSSQYQKLSRSEALRILIQRIIEGHGIITIQGIISLTNLSYDEVEATLSALKREGLILSGQFIEGIPIETYLVAKDLQRLNELNTQFAGISSKESEIPYEGKIIVDVLANSDPYTWRVAQQLADLYGSAFLNPIIVDGVLVGAADVRVTQDLLHVADLKVSELLVEKVDLLRRVGERFIEIATYYGLMAAEVEFVWGQPAVTEKNETLVKVFTELGYEIVGDRLCWGETPSEVLDEKVVRRFQFRKQHVDPETMGRTKEDVYRIMQDLGAIWTPWEDKLGMRIEGLRREWVEELLKKDRVLVEDVLLGSKPMLVPVKNWSTYWWACKTPVKLSLEAIKLLKIMRENGPISKRVLIRKSLMHELDVEHLLSTLSQMRLIINIGGPATRSIWVTLDQWLPTSVKLEDYVEPHEARRRITLMLLRNLGPLTVSQLRELTGLHSRQVRLILSELRDQGIVGLGRFLRSPRTQVQFVVLNDLEELHSLSSMMRDGSIKSTTHAFTIPPGDPLYYALKDEIKGTFRTGWCYTVVLNDEPIAAFKSKGAKKRHFIITDMLINGHVADKGDVVSKIVDQIDGTARIVGSLDIELKKINEKPVNYEGNQKIVEIFKSKGYKSGGLVLYKAFSVAIQPSGKEVFAAEVLTEFLMQRQHLAPQYKGKKKEDILRILHDVGRIELSDSIAVRMEEFNPVDLDDLKWREKRIVSGRFLSDNLTQIPADELLEYYYASRSPSFVLGYDEQRLIELLSSSGPLDEKQLSEKSGLDMGTLRSSLDNIEKAARVIRLRRSGSAYAADDWLYDVIDHYLPDGPSQFESTSPKDARKKIIMKFLAANGPVSLKQIEEWSHIEIAEIKSVLSELEAEGRISSNVYIEGIAGRRYVRKEDLTELRSLEESYLSQKLNCKIPYYVTLPNCDPLIKTWKDELLRAFSIGLIELGADYYMLTLKSGKPVAAMQVHYEVNTMRIHDMELVGTLDGKTNQDIIKELEGTAKESRKMEIQIEHICGRVAEDKLNKQQLERFLESGYHLSKGILHKKL
jgi:predicted ArsR family transcriptional regulator